MSHKSFSPSEINDALKNVFKRASGKERVEPSIRIGHIKLFFQIQAVNSIFLKRKCFHELFLMNNIISPLKSMSHFIFQQANIIIVRHNITASAVQFPEWSVVYFSCSSIFQNSTSGF